MQFNFTLLFIKKTPKLRDYPFNLAFGRLQALSCLKFSFEDFADLISTKNFKVILRLWYNFFQIVTILNIHADKCNMLLNAFHLQQNYRYLPSRDILFLKI